MIEVLRPGLLTTIQDLGRFGSRALGVPWSGALDEVSLRLANLLVGNAQDAAALEMTLLGLSLRFHAPALVAVVGARTELRLDDRAVRDRAPVTVRAGETLHVGPLRDGSRAYLAVRGGLNAWTVLGSASTNLHAAFGGHEGRALTRGDRLEWRDAPPLRVPRVHLSSPDPRSLTVRVLPGPEGDPAELTEYDWTVSPSSDRMGLRLSGPKLAAPRADLPSEPVVPGVVQIPPSGQPIVLLADAGTHGGYSRPLVAIRADLPLLGQLRPGDRFRFALVTPEEARAALEVRERDLRALAQAIRFAFERADT